MKLRFLPFALLALAGCGSTPTQPTPPQTPPVQAPPANAAPVVQSVVATISGRVEVDRDVVVTATVTDAETPVDALTYDWTASAGTVTGSGRTATWRLSRGAMTTPADVTIAVAVREPYDALENGAIVRREHRVEAGTAPFRVHDSAAEVGALAEKFLRLFVDNTASPEVCVQDFTPACPGRDAEISDIAGVRRGRDIHTWRLGPPAVQLTAGANEASVVVPCRFESRVIAKIDANDPWSPGDQVAADGDCELTARYLQSRWFLCTSRFFGSEVRADAGSVARRVSRRTIAAAVIGGR